jgi:hypothetical protein
MVSLSKQDCVVKKQKKYTYLLQQINMFLAIAPFGKLDKQSGIFGKLSVAAGK